MNNINSKGTLMVEFAMMKALMIPRAIESKKLKPSLGYFSCNSILNKNDKVNK
jgi:hypothetical protein